jgi:raffinose/stachyose/melibiose transport system substrate-binding protein
LLWERVKLALVLLFFAGLMFFTGRAQKDVLKQRDPRVINFLAKDYVPDLVQGGLDRKLTALRLLAKEYPPEQADKRREELLAVGLPEDLPPWERLAADKHRHGGEGFHQPWLIRFLEFPNLGPINDSWAVTRLMSGQAPEVMWAQGTPDFVQHCHEWFVNLSPYLERPNPYLTPEQQQLYPRWMDVFYADSLENWRSSFDRNIYLIPIDRVEIAIFYNRKIFEKCRIPEELWAPQTWEAFIDLQRRLKEGIARYGPDDPELRDVSPFLMPGATNMRIIWLYNILNDMLYAGLFDKLNYVDDPNLPTQSVAGLELIRAIQKGYISVDSERYWEAWRILREWSQYWQEGYLGTSDNEFFLLGKAAMAVDGSWMVKELKNDSVVNDPKEGFKWGTFFIPRITPATSRYSVNAPPRGVGGATAVQYAITKVTANRKEAVEAIVDFLMYITVPQHVGPLVAEAESFLPSIKDARLSRDLQFMEPVLKRGGIGFRGVDELNVACKDERWAVMQDFLGGRATREQVVQRMGQAVQAAVSRELTRNKDRWHWNYDSQGNNTWDYDIGPDSVLGRPTLPPELRQPADELPADWRLPRPWAAETQSTQRNSE